MDPVNDVLEHFGTKGMKWGVRKARSSASKASSFSKDHLALSSEGKVFAAQILATSGIVVVAHLTKR